MFLRVLLVSTLLGVSLADSPVAQLHISEHGAEYDETVEYDPATKAVTYHVPKHHDIVESTTIIHTPSNSMITLSENKICLLSSSPVGYNPELSCQQHNSEYRRCTDHLPVGLLQRQHIGGE